MNPILDELKVFTGNSHPALAQSVCDYLKIPMGQAEVFKFANDNSFARIHENIRQRDVFIVQPTCFPVNDNLMELLIMIDACKRASAGRITAVVPYYGYGRTDKKDRPSDRRRSGPTSHSGPPRRADPGFLQYSSGRADHTASYGRVFRGQRAAGPGGRGR